MAIAPGNRTTAAQAPERPELAALDDDALRVALSRMHLIRKFEETAEASYMRGLIHGTMHLSIGQEASAVGATLQLARDDYILSTHRGHGHCIAKGADPARMFAEFFGKENGYCRGRGGSMHIADIEGGNLGANGIVAGGLPIAVGVGMSIKAQKQHRVCMVFFGDGAANEGAFHEALNMASIWKLPIVFVCENNKYGMSMDIARAMAVPNVADRARGVRDAGRRRRRQRPARRRRGGAGRRSSAPARGGGPTLLECKTYRLRGHSKSDRNLYRTKEEIEAWRERDPIRRLEARAGRARPLRRGRIARDRAGGAQDDRRGAGIRQGEPRPRSGAADARRLCRLSLRVPEAANARAVVRRGDTRSARRRRWRRTSASSCSARTSACTAARSACPATCSTASVPSA